jgi:hypothetical protein
LGQIFDSHHGSHKFNNPLYTRTATILKNSIFWDITSCSPLKINRRFGGTSVKLCFYLIDADSSTLKMVTCSCQRTVDFQRIIWLHIPEDRTLHNHPQILHSVKHLGAWFMYVVWIGESIYWPLVYTTRNYTSHITDTQTSVPSLLVSAVAVSWQQLLPREILQLPALRSSCHSGACRTLVNWQLSYLRPRLAAISHQPPSLLFTGWLPAVNWTLSLIQLLHSTEPLATYYFGTLMTILITSQSTPCRKKNSFHCYSSTTPRPLCRNGCLFVRLLHSNSCFFLQSHRLATGLYYAIVAILY